MGIVGREGWAVRIDIKDTQKFHVTLPLAGVYSTFYG